MAWLPNNWSGASTPTGPDPYWRGSCTLFLGSRDCGKRSLTGSRRTCLQELGAPPGEAWRWAPYLLLAQVQLPRKRDGRDACDSSRGFGCWGELSTVVIGMCPRSVDRFSGFLSLVSYVWTVCAGHNQDLRTRRCRLDPVGSGPSCVRSCDCTCMRRRGFSSISSSMFQSPFI